MSRPELSDLTVSPRVAPMNFQPSDAEQTLNESVEKIITILKDRGYKNYLGTEVKPDFTGIVDFVKESMTNVDLTTITTKDGILIDFTFNQNGGCWYDMLCFLGESGYKISYVVPPKLEVVMEMKVSELMFPIPTCEYPFHQLEGKGYSCVISVPELFDADHYNYTVTFLNVIEIPKDGVIPFH